MSCGWDHIYKYSYYNPYDEVDVYECVNCGKVKSEKSRSAQGASVQPTSSSSESQGASMSNGCLFATIFIVVFTLFMLMFGVVSLFS